MAGSLRLSVVTSSISQGRHRKSPPTITAETELKETHSHISGVPCMNEHEPIKVSVGG